MPQFIRHDFHPGQRWISESEPELGLGSIVRVTDRRVTAVFGASRQKREYARANAPLRRVRFRVGDLIKTNAGKALAVDSVSERGGLIYYGTNGQEICETELSDTISFNKPEERLFSVQFDPPQVFDVRVAALEHQYRRRKSSVRGFTGGRIELIPHQLYIAAEVTGRLVPRVLLADEVGLGKTIEACLILHRLLLTGRVQRVLILVPETLVHQWFVELLRRFNLWFHIFDEERCRAIESVNPDANPFLDGQLLLCSMRLFTQHEVRKEQAIEAGWDMLVVDEAHHLAWAPGMVSPEYAFVEALSRKTVGLLLLTATPEQLGVAAHFARLRLLDPDRFYDLDEFVKEAKAYREVAERAAAGSDRAAVVALLDQHGTGRVSFRNTRATITGFPSRTAHLVPLKGDSGRQERVDWLAGLLLELDPHKILLICRTQASVATIEVALRQRVKNLKAAVFHEGLSLLQRDRNAAWFADPHGARILLCSEIGSEGRNFQFAHHLVLFDLPLDPELLEQRIGRLDRIGQTSEIQIYLPFVIGSGQEVLARWFHDGLNAFEKNLQGGREVLEHFGARVYDLIQQFPKKTKAVRAELDRLIQDSKVERQRIAAQLQEGRDRLLELNSYRPEVAKRIVEDIRQQDADEALDEFMLSIFNLYSISVEELAPRTYRLGSAGVLADRFPGLPAEGLTVTCDRRRALIREDIQFLTWDHPLVTGALDLVLGSEKGNSTFAMWRDPKTTGLYLEATYILECVAPPGLHIDRFLPPTPLRIVVDHQGKDVRHLAIPTLERADAHDLLEEPEVREELVPHMIERSQELAEKRVAAIVDKARDQMNDQLQQEITRLQQLRKVNKTIRKEEIDLLAEQRRSLDAQLMQARLRLEAIRLIQRGVF